MQPVKTGMFQILALPVALDRDGNDSGPVNSVVFRRGRKSRRLFKLQSRFAGLLDWVGTIRHYHKNGSSKFCGLLFCPNRWDAPAPQ